MLNAILMLTVIAGMVQMAGAASTCEFNLESVKVNTPSQVKITFKPESHTADFNTFQARLPNKLGLPITSPYNQLQSIFQYSDLMQDPTAALSSIFVLTEDGSEIVLTVNNLKKDDNGLIENYEFTFSLLGGPYEATLDPTTFGCKIMQDSTTVYEATSSDMKLSTGSSTTVVAMRSSTKYVTVTSSSDAAGDSATLTIEYESTAAFLANTYVIMTVPKRNWMFGQTGQNNGFALQFASNLSSAKFYIDGTQKSISSYQISGDTSSYADDIWIFQIQKDVEATAGAILKLTVDVSNPSCEYELIEGWRLKTVTSQGVTDISACESAPQTSCSNVEQSKTPLIAGTGLGITKYRTNSAGNSMAIEGSMDGIGVTGASYKFTLRRNNMIPAEGAIIITVPTAVTIPSNSASSLSFSCDATYCSSGSSATMAWTSSSRELKISGAFSSSAMSENEKSLIFTISGWQNPNDSSSHNFYVQTCFQENSSNCKQIEYFTGMSITATQGLCQVQQGYVTNGDTRIYAQALSYTFVMWCNHAIETNYGIRITWPSDYIVMDRSSCRFTGYSTRYYCQIFANTNILEVRQFTTTTIAAKDLITFSIDSVISPGTISDATKAIKIDTIDSYGNPVDTGSYTFDQRYFTPGNITTFTVKAQSSAVGLAPVKYDFNIVPNGEVPRYGYIELKLPVEVSIPNEKDFENSCGEHLYALTNSVISCVVRDGGRTLQIKDGFLYKATTNLTDSDGLYYPPDIQFTLNGFQNPRAQGYSSPWNVTIYNEWDKELYYWQTADAPTLYVSGVSQPSYFEPIFENRINGAFSYLEFLVTTVAGVSEGDKVIVKLPYGWQFSTESEVFGRSNNLVNYMEPSISVDQRQIEFNLEMSFALKRQLADQMEEEEDDDSLLGRRNLAAEIKSGSSFQFRITEMKNFISFRPSDASIEYYVYSTTGILVEENRTGHIMTNNQTGSLNGIKNGIIPGDFRTDFDTNYTLTLQVANFEKNMAFTLTLPTEISFTEEDPFCIGVSGVDNDVLRCDTDRDAKTLKFTNAMQFAPSNPGEMVIVIEKLRNPSENVVTSSFGIKTESYDGYAMDELTTDLTINFYCEYPCANCPQGSPSQCDSCYQTAVERYFHDAKCLAECPDGKVETADLTCTDCISPCVTCDGTPNSCLSCIDGYYVVDDYCREEVAWYFPFLGSAFLFFILITVSEIVTKRASNFKESLIAFWSIPEVLSWVCVTWFMWHRTGQATASGLAVLACMLYVCLNCVHAIIHPRYMVPHTLYSYKQLLTDYKCGTFLARAVSYLVSFKFSLILVSHFFGSPRLKGDYSAMNWKQFNRFSLAFCVVPYPVMMAACAYFIATDGFWSYPGFVAAEVVSLSTVMTMLLAIDALSAIKCKTVGKKKTNKAIRVATGADYESDEDEVNLKKQIVRAERTAKTSRHQKADDFGVDDSEYGSEVDSVMELQRDSRTHRGLTRVDAGVRTSRPRLDSEQSYRSNNSRLSQQTAIMNDEARKQIAMLEELAHQMREEKRQLQLEKERVEREKQELQEDRARSQHHLEQYMDDYQRQTTALSNRVQEMEKQKLDIVHQVESRLEEGNRANQILAEKIQEANNQKAIMANQQVRKNFRDFEGEMEDYEPVEEENSEEAESSIADVVDSAQLPVLPAFGQIDYYRQMEGEDQHWMQQITPRAGGDSMLGQHDMEDEMELQMEKNATAHYEIASIPPSRYDDQMENGVVEAEFHELNSQLEANKSEEFHQQSDAEYENISDKDVKEAVQQDYFEPERAIFSALQDREERNTQQEFFANVNNPVFEEVERPPTRHAVEQQFFANIEPRAGEADKTDERLGEDLHFFKQEAPQFGEVLEEGEMERQATAQHFFQPERPMQGEADDAHRSNLATPQEFIQRTKQAVFGADVEDPNEREAAEMRHFVQEAAVKEDASDIGRSRKASVVEFQQREEAFLDKDLNDERQREGTEHQFFEREAAMYSQDRSVANRNATQSEFFKHDEAVRGDVTSADRSVAATQQNYFQQQEKPELGRPDSYARFKSDVQQEFMNKSELGGLSDNRHAAGLATPHGTQVADPIDYMNKSEAEFGRQSTVHEQDATQQKFFEQEKNPEFGRGEHYVRNVEAEQEYNPPPEEDSSGRSAESSEGGIADHQPFTAGAIPMARNKKQGQNKNPNVRPYEEDQEAALMKNRGQPSKQQRQPKTILYSDKSETSVEDLMDDTPSNYNIQNGRFEGKSLGLKALLLHARNYQNQTLDPVMKGANGMQVLEGLGNLAAEQNRSPQQMRPGPGILSPGMLGAQKGIIGSQKDERNFVNNLYQTGQSIGGQSANNQWRAGGPMGGRGVPVIGEESSANGDAAQPRNTRSQVRTNKHFVDEDKQGRGARAGSHLPPSGFTGARSPNAQNLGGRGAPKITKNNFLGGST